VGRFVRWNQEKVVKTRLSLNRGRRRDNPGCKGFFAPTPPIEQHKGSTSLEFKRRLASQPWFAEEVPGPAKTNRAQMPTFMIT